MNQKQLKHYKDLLIEERGKVLKQLLNDKDKLGDLNKHEVGDLADAAFSLYEKDMAIEMSEKEKKLLTSIEAALERIKRGQFGSCVRCGSPIDAKRLDVLPWATQCADPKSCQKQTSR